MPLTQPARAVPAILVLAAITACSPDKTPEPRQKAASPPALAPAIPPPLGRVELLSAVADATDATASNAVYPSAVAALGGRTFRLSIPFGCHGPDAEAPLRYEFDAARRTLRLTAAPDPLMGEAWARAAFASEAPESIEGFWLPRPWSTSEACPPAAPQPASVTDDRDVSADALEPVRTRPLPTPETLALVRVSGASDSRTQRRDERPYRITTRLPEGVVPGVGGYRLVIEGRLDGGSESQPVRCQSADIDVRPVCLVRVAIDRVAFTDQAGAMLGEWRG